ncbi:aminoglycoside phosphotransferase family protein [Shimia sp.]|uniref:aminoglycoside phosphotransferase family protein n=1 Tax=Shimia sp. TaxID=1954381 RepID=UPI00356846DB
MAERDAAMLRFLASAGWAGARRVALAGDASSRRYFRLSRGGQSAVLMDARAQGGDGLAAFIRIARWLTGIGLSAPKILFADPAAGLLLLEDLGDALFARILEETPGSETELYRAAVDVVIATQRQTPPEGLVAFDPALLADQSLLLHEWYLAAQGRRPSCDAASFRAAFETVLRQHCATCDVLIQRDFHAENLIWRPERAGLARVGLLDFQDAMLGHRAYDLMSLLQDARRDVTPETEAAMIAHYLGETGAEPEAFRAAYAVLGAQRNLRILGIFARLSLHFGKPHYVDLIPRVWQHVARNLAHPALAGVRRMLEPDLPFPDDQFLKGLKDRCGTIPTL